MEKVVVDNEDIRGYLINSLTEGRNDYLNILFLASKNYWELVSRLPEFYPNIDVETGYYDAIEYGDVEFFNINIIKSNEEFKEKNYNMLKELAYFYLQGHYDTFVMAYSFYSDSNEEALVISCNKGIIKEERFILPKDTQSSVINLATKKYDEIKNTLLLKRVK